MYLAACVQAQGSYDVSLMVCGVSEIVPKGSMWQYGIYMGLEGVAILPLPGAGAYTIKLLGAFGVVGGALAEDMLVLGGQRCWSIGRTTQLYVLTQRVQLPS